MEWPLVRVSVPGTSVGDVLPSQAFQNEASRRQHLLIRRRELGNVPDG
jgi:hypothetical protein